MCLRCDIFTIDQPLFHGWGQPATLMQNCIWLAWALWALEVRQQNISLLLYMFFWFWWTGGYLAGLLIQSMTRSLVNVVSTVKLSVVQVEDKTKFWAGTYYWTGTKFRAAGSKFWSAKSRVRLAGVTENAGRTCRKLSGIKRFFASRE